MCSSDLTEELKDSLVREITSLTVLIKRMRYVASVQMIQDIAMVYWKSASGEAKHCIKEAMTKARVPSWDIYFTTAKIEKSPEQPTHKEWLGSKPMGWEACLSTLYLIRPSFTHEVETELMPIFAMKSGTVKLSEMRLEMKNGAPCMPSEPKRERRVDLQVPRGVMKKRELKREVARGSVVGSVHERLGRHKRIVYDIPARRSKSRDSPKPSTSRAEEDDIKSYEDSSWPDLYYDTEKPQHPKGGHKRRYL